MHPAEEAKSWEHDGQETINRAISTNAGKGIDSAESGHFLYPFIVSRCQDVLLN